MGAANVGAVLLTWGALPHRARLVLIAMAHLSLDDNSTNDRFPARHYWHGPGYLAEVLYGSAGVASRDDYGDPIPTPSALRQVEKCLTELVRAGALRRLVKGHNGRGSRYEVLVTPASSPTETVGSSPTETVGVARPKRSALPDPDGRAKEQEEQEEQREEKITVVHHKTAREDDEGEKEWTDVKLTGRTSTVTGEQYDHANAYLLAQLGIARAAEAVGKHLDEHPDDGYLDAVVHVARQRGWAAA